MSIVCVQNNDSNFFLLKELERSNIYNLYKTLQMDLYIVQEQLYTFENTEKRAELENNGTFYSTGLKTNNKPPSPPCKPLGPLTPPPLKKKWRKQNYNGFYKNELQIVA